MPHFTLCCWFCLGLTFYIVRTKTYHMFQTCWWSLCLRTWKSRWRRPIGSNSRNINLECHWWGCLYGSRCGWEWWFRWNRWCTSTIFIHSCPLRIRATRSLETPPKVSQQWTSRLQQMWLFGGECWESAKTDSWPEQQHVPATFTALPGINACKWHFNW